MRVELLLHPNTSKQIDDFLASPSHALLICGPVGSGKGTTAAYIASKALGIEQDKLTDHPYVRWLHDQEKGVAIEDIRNAQNFMQLKVPGSHMVRRVLIVEQGESMSNEAQNAFLKLLEEPPADSLIIITSTGLEKVLPTIRSRTQTLQILPPNLSQLNKYYEGQYSTAAILKASYISEGYMGAMKALLEQDSDHPLVAQIAVAKTLLSANSYQRLCMIEEVTKQKNVGLLLHAMERVCHAALVQSAKNGSPETKRWTSRLKSIVMARNNLEMNAQPKLLLTDLMLSL